MTTTAQHFLALDLGAESGRGILGHFDGQRLTLKEIGRFATSRDEGDVCPDGVLRWDFDRIGREIDALVARAQREAGTLQGVGADTWGVDFGLLDTLGRLLEAPTHYRNASHLPAMQTVHAPGTRWAFLSSGTWSLLGVERPMPNLSPEAFLNRFSNELGVGGTVRFLKNIMGLWLVQECRRLLSRSEGRTHSYPELAAQAEAVPTGGPVVDGTAHRFLAPADMAAEIRAASRESGQPAPEGIGPLIRCCLDSLASAYRQALRHMEETLGRNSTPYISPAAVHKTFC